MGEKKKTKFDSELGIYIVKEDEKEYSTGDNKAYKVTQSKYYNRFYGYKDFENIKVTFKEILDFINLMFSGKHNFFSEREEFRKELKISKDKFLEISVNLNKHIRKHNLEFYMNHLRKGNKSKKIVLSMNGDIKNV